MEDLESGRLWGDLARTLPTMLSALRASPAYLRAQSGPLRNGPDGNPLHRHEAPRIGVASAHPGVARSGRETGEAGSGSPKPPSLPGAAWLRVLLGARLSLPGESL